MKFPNNSKVFLIFFLLLIFQKNSIANECLIKKELNIGFIENNYIDYKYYLYYALGEYSLINDVEFTISEVNQNANEFDIIFGEFRDLAKLSLNQFQVPNKVLNFYNDNEVEVMGNIFPLDLDTFILLSQDDYEKLNFEEFSELYNPIKYTANVQKLEKSVQIYTSNLNSNPKIEKFKQNIFIGHPNILKKEKFDIFIPVKTPGIDSNGIALRSDGIGVLKLEKKIDSNYIQLDEIVKELKNND